MPSEMPTPEFQKWNRETPPPDPHPHISASTMNRWQAWRAAEQAAAEREREACAAEVPTTWLDPMLTGDKAVIGKPPWGCPDVEKLLRAVRDLIRARAALEEKPPSA